MKKETYHLFMSAEWSVCDIELTPEEAKVFEKCMKALKRGEKTTGFFSYAITNLSERQREEAAHREMRKLVYEAGKTEGKALTCEACKGECKSQVYEGRLDPGDIAEAGCRG